MNKERKREGERERRGNKAKYWEKKVKIGTRTGLTQQKNRVNKTSEEKEKTEKGKG